MSYPPEVRQRAVELSEQGLAASQVRAQLIREDCRSVPSAASISGWARNACHGSGVDKGWRSAELIAEVVRANVTTSASTREIGWRFRVAASSVTAWTHKFAPDAGSRRGMTPQEIEQATLARVKEHHEAQKRKRKKAETQRQSQRAPRDESAHSRNHEQPTAPFDEAALPDDVEALKDLLRQERFMRLADKALFEAVMESEGKAQTRRRSTAWSSLRLSDDSGTSDTK